MGLILRWTVDENLENLKSSLQRLVYTIQTFRRSLFNTRAHMHNVIFPGSTEDQTDHHETVFQTVLALHVHSHTTSKAAKLIRVIKKNYYNRATSKWADTELDSTVNTLKSEIIGCEEETKVMLLELAEKFVVFITIVDDPELADNNDDLIESENSYRVDRLNGRPEPAIMW